MLNITYLIFAFMDMTQKNTVCKKITTRTPLSIY